jgi:hypothetical protein
MINAAVKLLLLVHIIYTPLMSSTTRVFLFINIWCFIFTYALMQLNLVCFARGKEFFKPWLPLSSCQALCLACCSSFSIFCGTEDVLPVSSVP